MQKITLLIIAVIVALAVRAAADCPGSAVAPEAIRPLLHAVDATTLDLAFRAIASPGPAVVAVYHSRRLALRHSSSEELEFLRSLPRSEQELSAVYQLSFIKDLCEDPVVSSTVYDMFQTAANLAERHGAFHGRVLQLCLWSNAETGEVAWPECDSLLAKDPVTTIRALRSLSAKDRSRMCDGHDPRKLSTREILRLCQSGL